MSMRIEIKGYDENQSVTLSDEKLKVNYAVSVIVKEHKDGIERTVNVSRDELMSAIIAFDALKAKRQREDDDA